MNLPPFWLVLMMVGTLVRASDLMENPPQMVSPHGIYELKRSSTADSDMILTKINRAPVLLTGFEPIKDWKAHYPTYKIIWSENDASLALIRVTFRRSDLILYRLEKGKAIRITLPDFDDIIDPKEQAIAPKKDLPTLKQRLRHFETFKFEDANTPSFMILTYYVSDIEDLDFFNSFRLRIKNGKATVVDYKIK